MRREKLGSGESVHEYGSGNALTAWRFLIGKQVVSRFCHDLEHNSALAATRVRRARVQPISLMPGCRFAHGAYLPSSDLGRDQAMDEDRRKELCHCRREAQPLHLRSVIRCVSAVVYLCVVTQICVRLARLSSSTATGCSSTDVLP
jgi:hypothetical protein